LCKRCGRWTRGSEIEGAGVLALVVLGLATTQVSAWRVDWNGVRGWWRSGLQEGKRVKSAGAALVQGSAAAASISLPSVVGVVLYFLKVGAVLFGMDMYCWRFCGRICGALHWLTENQFDRCDWVSQGTPGPFFTVATFVGYVIAGWKGAVLATAGMFLPAFVFCGRDGEIFAEIAEVTDGWHIFGWSECGGGGVDGVCGMAVCAGDDVECDSDCNGDGCDGFSYEISREFGMVGFGWRVGGDGDAVVAFGIAGGVARMC